MSNETQTPFRIGGVYRDEAGRVCKLTEPRENGKSALCEVLCEADGRSTCKAYWRSLATGRDPSGLVLDCGNKRHLLRGELHQVNGEWVPVEAMGVELQRPRLTWADSKPVDRFPGFSVSYDGEQQNTRPQSRLQRVCMERDPVHGSAALLKVR